MMIFGILLLSLFFRLINLNQSLWLDEAVQAVTAKESLSFIFQEIRGDFHPPLYYFLMHGWGKIFGYSEIALRLPSVIFGVGTVFLIYKIGSLLKNKSFGLIAALFLASAPFHIFYSQEARMYSMVTFFGALSMYFFLRVKENKKYKILYFLATLLMLYSDYYGFLVFLAQIIYLIMKKEYKFLILNTFFLILLYTPWLPMFITQIKTGLLLTQILPEWGRLVNLSFFKALPLTLVKFSIGRITIFDKNIYALLSGAIVSTIGFLIAKGYFRGKKLLITNYQLLITFWLFVPLLVSWTFSLFVPNYQPFRLLLVLPAFYLLLTFGMESILNLKLKKLAISFLLGINLISLAVYYLNPYFHREDWRGLTSFLKKQKTIVILPSDTSNWPIKYYDSQNEIMMVYGGTGTNEIEEFRQQENIYGKIYFIRYLVPLFDIEEKILAALEDKGYTKTREINFNQIPLWEFNKK